MSDRFTQEELEQVIGEIEKVQSRNETEFTRKQVEEILQELNLSPDLLDEALVQLRRKQALKAQQKRNKKIGIATFATFLIILGLSMFFWQRQEEAIAKVQVQQDRIALTLDRGNNFSVIERQNSPQIFYQVTLKNAPIGQSLDLSCNWINPNGEIVKQNRYQTSNITTSVWKTHCRYNIGSATPVGKWQVQMFLNGRQLSEADFEVK